jgi:hypothetical protein
VAEGARLESVYTGNRIVGSNPTPSARTPCALVHPHSPTSAQAAAKTTTGQVQPSKMPFDDTVGRDKERGRH